MPHNVQWQQQHRSLKLLVNELSRSSVRRREHLDMVSALLAGRISYLYGLNGPSMAIDTACSSSLVAVSSGRSALLLGASAEALAGGVTLMLSPTTMAMYAVAGAHGY